MAATGHSSWADLNSELLVSIAATAVRGSSLQDYVCLRGVCAAWRSALPPPYPCLLSLDDDGARSASVFSLPMRRSFRLYTAVEGCFDVTELPTRARVVAGSGNRHLAHVAGSGNGPLARFVRARSANGRLARVDGSGNGRVTGSSNVRLARVDGSGNGRVAGSSNVRLAGSGNGHLTRVVGSGHGRLAFAIDSSTSKDTYAGCWTVRIFVLDPHTGDGDELLPPRNRTRTNMEEDCEYVVRKILFAPDPDDATVVAMCGCTKIAYVDTSKNKSRRKLDLVWTTVDVVTGVAEHLVDLAFDATGGKVYCLDSRGGVHVLRVPHGGRNRQEAPTEPSMTHMSAAFYPPYDVVFTLTSRKHLFFCHGSLYQVWQNSSSTVRSCSGLTMTADEIFVLRYDLRRQSWNMVKDLGGCSVFISKNNIPAVVRAGTLRGVRGDCVYWIDWRRVPMVCDVATGTSKPCDFPGGACKGNSWYFGDDNMRSTNKLRY